MTISSKFKDFLRATKPVSVNFRLLRYFKLSEEELSIPGIDELELALIDNKVELVEAKLKALKTDSQQVASFNRFILSLIDRNKGRRIPLSNIVSSSLLTVQHQVLKLDVAFCNKIADLLNDDGALGPELQNFEPTLVFDQVLSQCNEGDKNGIMDRYIELLSKRKENEEPSKPPPDYVSGLLKELVGHKDWLGVRKQEVSKALANRYYTYEMLSIFKGNPDDQKDFVSEEAIANFVSTFSSEDIEAQQGIRDKTDLFLDFRGIIGANALQAIITKLRELLDAENQKPYREEKENLLACIQDIFGAFGKLMPMLSQDILNPFADAVTKGINVAGDWTQKKIFVLTCLWLIDMCEEPRKSSINELTRTFFSGADVESMNFVFDKLNNDKKKDELIERYNDAFQQRVLQDQRIFDLLYPLAPKDTRTQWLITLINSAHQRALTKLKELSYKVDDKKSVVATLLTRVEKVPPGEREDFYNICNKMKYANDIDLREKFASQLKSLLKNTNPDLQKAGFTALQDAIYLPATQKRDIARETVEWLRTLQPDNAGQSGSAQSVLIYWGLLPQPLQGDFLDFIFDKLIKRGDNIENIGLGFEILRKTEPKPKYEEKEHSTYFDDILARAEAESNAEIKSELVEGLFSLKPDKVNRQNEDFWRKVEGLKP